MAGLPRHLWLLGMRRLREIPLSSWRDIRAGFILSTGRTGTLRIAEVIASATQGVHSYHEPAPDLFHLGENFVRGGLSNTEGAAVLRRSRQPLCNRLSRSAADTYVEANTNAGYLADVIRSVFDKPRFIHIVRDGRAVVRSLYSKSGPSRRPGHDRTLFMDHDDRRCRLAAVDFPNDSWSSQWPYMSRFERICWHWARKNALIREALGASGDALVLKFEDIFDQDRGFPGFWKLVDFLEIEERIVRSEAEIDALLSTPRNRSADYHLPHPTRWSSALRDTFDKIAGSEQRLYYS